MDERDNKALNKGLSFEKASARLIKASNSMSNIEETNKLSAEEYLKKLDVPIKSISDVMESFASMRVEEERKDKNAIIEQVKFLLERNGKLEQEKKEWEQEIYFLNNSSNFQ